MSDRPPQENDPRWRLTPTKIVVSGILLVGIVVPLLVSTYDQKEPEAVRLPVLLLVPADLGLHLRRTVRAELLAAETGAGRLPARSYGEVEQ